MKPEFHEDYHNDQSQPVGDSQQYDFDWETLFENLGENDEESGAKIAFALGKIVEWVIEVDLTRPNACQHVGRRMLALAWVVNPNWVGKPNAANPQKPSLTKLAKRLGISKVTMSQYTSAASRAFGIKNQFQSHDWRKPKTEDTNG